MIRRTLALAAVLCLGAAPLWAQRWRTLDASRQLHDSGAVDVRIEYGAGKIDLRPSTSANTLYSMNLRYDAEHSEPLSRWDSVARRLDLGIKSSNMRWSKGDNEGGRMHAELSTQVEMDLSLHMGAVEGDFDLGGLRLTDLTVKSGAADVTVRFDTPNAATMRDMVLEVGAASLKVRRAGNARAEHIKASVGVGSLDLDLGGEWTKDIDVDASVAMGGFTLRVPSDAGVKVKMSSFLAGFDKTGMTKRSDGWWYSQGYDNATRRVRVEMNAAFGSFSLKRDSR